MAFLSLKGREGGGRRFRTDLARAMVPGFRRLALGHTEDYKAKNPK